jgi:biofilm PGA synthesis protein PgaD
MSKGMQDSTIQMRQFLSARQRAREALITTALWVLYGYLWLPLISLVAWYLGVDFGYETVIKAGGPDELILLLLWFSIVCLVSLLVVVSWSGFQYSQFKGKGERRTRETLLDLEAEREFWQIDEALQEQLKSGKVMKVSLDDDAKITGVLTNN